ncbi:MAG: preprotein translocase subunit SecE [Candidatus Omnitrophica bacterium]|nr:preprotein translocase subunit SecE [Candidatus Omnitrophota bacterium]
MGDKNGDKEVTMAKIKVFLDEVKTELKKVSWSSREDLIASTIVVLASVAFLAIFIGIVDFVVSRAVNIIIR